MHTRVNFVSPRDRTLTSTTPLAPGGRRHCTGRTTALRNNPEGTTTPHSVPTPSQHHHCCIATTNTLALAAHPPHTPPRPRPLTAPTTMQPHHTPLPITPARSACRTSHTSDTQHMQWYTPPARHCALRPKHSRMPSMPWAGALP